MYNLQKFPPWSQTDLEFKFICYRHLSVKHLELQLKIEINCFDSSSGFNSMYTLIPSLFQYQYIGEEGGFFLD